MSEWSAGSPSRSSPASPRSAESGVGLGRPPEARIGRQGVGRSTGALRRRSFAGPAAAILLASCHEGPGGRCTAAPFTIWDSADVQVATTGGCDALRPLGWQVDTNPDLDLGGYGVEGEPPFFEAGDARQLRNGTLAVVDRSTNTVRFMTDGGGVTVSVGRRGRGPGEFLSPIIVGDRPWVEALDSLGVLVFDLGLRRLSWVAADGDMQSETVLLPEHIGGVQGFVGGRFLTRRRSTPSVFDEGVFGGGVADFLLVDPASAEVRRLAGFAEPRVANFFASGQLNSVQLPFDVSPSSAVGRDRLWLAGEGRPEIQEYGRDGTLQRVLRIAQPSRAATQKDLDSHLRVIQRSLSTSEAARVWAREISKTPWRGTLPIFDGLLADTSTLVWARVHSVDPGRPREWVVVGDDGRALGTVLVPAGLKLTQVGADFVLGLWEDSLGVWRVRRHTLARGGSGGGPPPVRESPPR